MPIHIEELPRNACLVRLQHAGRPAVAVWSEGKLNQARVGLDELLRLPRAEMREELEHATRRLDPGQCELLAPVESQEVWAAGVTYLRSRVARMEESSEADVYAKVYEAERPEIFFKSAGWRVVGHGGVTGVRPDSIWNVPEPELAVLSNSRGEVVAYACGNDMSSRSIEGENPLYLPQAKVYDRSCSIGPAAVLAWEVDEPNGARITMQIKRGSELVFDGEASLSEMVRDPAELSAVLHSAYPLPAGAWLMTGTSLVPPLPYTAEADDVVMIDIEGIGRLVNTIAVVPHSGALAPPRLANRPKRGAQ
jgi:2-dehydro-3-deoxy-D-arabinonate dehydratase